MGAELKEKQKKDKQKLEEKPFKSIRLFQSHKAVQEVIEKCNISPPPCEPCG